VRILDNIFDNCNFTQVYWDRSVIVMQPREAFDGKNYYHKYIEVAGNKFINNRGSLLSADNVERFVWKDNLLENSECRLEFKNCGQIERDPSKTAVANDGRL
jgi:hypothetical protein